MKLKDIIGNFSGSYVWTREFNSKVKKWETHLANKDNYEKDVVWIEISSNIMKDHSPVFLITIEEV